MLDRVGGFMREVGRIVRSHHERWDGGGYPDGLAGEAIPLEARIIACCDAWNAMTTDRPYRDGAVARTIALAELRANAGTQFDPAVVTARRRSPSRAGPRSSSSSLGSQAAGPPSASESLQPYGRATPSGVTLPP